MSTVAIALGLSLLGGLGGFLVASGVLPPSADVWAVDADAMFVRPGPRLVDGVETLAGICHPEVAAIPPGAAVRITTR